MPKRKLSSDAAVSIAVYNQIAPLLVGIPAPIQGNILAMLVAAWLAGHKAKIPNDPKKSLDETIALRGRLMVLTTKTAFAYVRDAEKGATADEAR